jgi:hypothetical protein
LDIAGEIDIAELIESNHQTNKEQQPWMIGIESQTKYKIGKETGKYDPHIGEKQTVKTAFCGEGLGIEFRASC